MNTFVAIPCMDSLDVRFVQSLVGLQLPEDSYIEFLPGSLVYDARNKLAQRAVAFGAEYILWLDSDMSFPGNILGKLMEDIKDKDFVSGLYFTRRPPWRPTLFERCGTSPEDFKYLQHLGDELTEIEACGFGCVLMRTKIVEDILKTGDLPFSPIPGLGEDLSFCIRARQAGYKLYADPRLIVGHVAQLIIGNNEIKQDWNLSPM